MCALNETARAPRLPVPCSNFSVVLASLRGNYSFNRFLTFTSLIQLDTSNTQAVGANLAGAITIVPAATSTSCTTSERSLPTSPQQIRRESVRLASPSP
jgi:hypothetical protein